MTGNGRDERLRFRSSGLGSLLALWGLAALASCAAPPAPSDHYYRLRLETLTRSERPVLEGILEIDRFRAPAVLQGRRLAYRVPAHESELKLAAYHHWTDATPDLVQNALTKRLRESGIAERVTIPTLRIAPTYLLSGRIAEFERIVDPAQPRVQIELELALIRESDHSLLLQRTYRERVEAAEDTFRAAAEALSTALDRIAGDFIRDTEAIVQQARP